MCNGCVKILIDYTDPRPWDEQKLDWQLKANPEIIYRYIYMDQMEHDNKMYIIESADKPKTRYCICGHVIAKQFYVYNDKRRQCYQMGSVCICRYKKRDPNDNGAFRGNEQIENDMIDLHKYHCETCNKTMGIERVLKHNNSPTHIKNYKIKNFRMCRSCKQYNIEKTKPSYYHSCSQCYKFNPKLRK